MGDRGEHDVTVSDALGKVVAAAREGASKAAHGQPDVWEFDVVASYIGWHLEHKEPQALIAAESALRTHDRAALSWYLSIQRTLIGTVAHEGHVHHLVLLPMIALRHVGVPVTIGCGSPFSRILEEALNLGDGTLAILPEAYALTTLEVMTPIQWRSLAADGTQDPSSSAQCAFTTAGAVIGRWSVPCSDRPRLSRKLLHAFQPTHAMRAWKAGVDARLLELHPNAGLQVFPPLLLQDFFTRTRQILLRAEIEEACSQCMSPRRLEWSWDELCGRLIWRVVSERGTLSPPVVSYFPDEPDACIREHIDRLARQFDLA